RHGFAEDPIAWTLDTDKRAVNKVHAGRGGTDGPGLATCPRCDAIRNRGEGCLSCGWQPARKSRSVEFIEGDLGHAEHDRTVHVLSHDEASFYCELRYIESARQYKPGWAAHQFKKKFGRFPPWSWNNHQPRQPSPATIAWVRSRQIAYAKALRS